MSIFPRLVDILLPSGGYALPLVETYFDESGTHQGSKVLCLAGYVVESEAGKRLSDDWALMLERYGLPFFHMVDCVHGRPPFDGLTRKEQDEAERSAIRIMRTHINQCFVVSLMPEVFDRYVPASPLIGSPYSVCIHACLGAAQAWADINAYRGDIAYFFESGHQSQSEANRIMTKIFSVPALRDKQRYVAHTFADKRKVFPLQAADIIAWLWNNECKRKMDTSRPQRRRDLNALMQPKDDGSLFFAGAHLDAKFLRGLATPVLRSQYFLTYPWR